MKQKKIIVATNNEHKVKEIFQLMNVSRFKFESMKNEKILVEPEETGETFLENALIKAKEVAKHTKHPVMADDSGLIVDCLDGQPGVFSKRYAGKDATDEENNLLLMENVKKFPFEKRTAHFKCVIALIMDDGKEYAFDGISDGHIILEKKGTQGFGYDPIFYVPKLNKTFAQLTMEEKNLISHRGRAIQKLKEFLKEY